MTQTQKSKRPEQVLVTGIGGALGSLVAHKLAKRFHVIGVDRRPQAAHNQNMEYHELDLRRKSAFVLLKKKPLDAIIHIGVIRNPLKHTSNASAYYFNLEITSQLLKLAEQLNVRKFIFLSTANLYGPSHATSGFLDEDAALHGADRSPELRDLVALDMMIQSFFWKQPQIETVILRPAHIVGPHLNNAPTRYLKLDHVPTLMGHDPMLQLIHEDDLASAMLLALTSSARGIFNLCGNTAAPLSRVLRTMGKTHTPIPEILFRGALNLAFMARMSTFPPGELDHLKYPCLINDARARRELLFKPKHSLKSTLLELRT